MIARSEFQIHVATVAEYAGAVEGIRELEHALGRAKALGHDHASLEKQLAKARAGVRHFHGAHPEFRGLTARLQTESHPEDAGASQTAEEPGGGTGQGQIGSGPVRGPIARSETAADPGIESGVVPGSQGKAPGDGSAVRPPLESQSASSPASVTPTLLTGYETDLASGAENSQAFLTGTPSPGAGDADTAVRPAEIPPREDSGAAWNAELFRQEFEGMLRALLEEQEMVRARAGVAEAEQEQTAARQAEIEARLREAEARLRYNRDAG